VAVLTYHALVERPEELDGRAPGTRRYVLTLEEFSRHLGHLAEGGFATVAMADLVRWHEGEAELPERAVVVSFDDGHRSNAELAAPALAERGQRAIFFVTAGRVGCDDSVTWPQLRAMLGQGMEVGSHTLTHRCPSSLSRAELRHELAESKRVLEDGTGAAVDFVASPTGYDNRHFGAVAREVGYRAALQGVIGRNFRSTGRYALRRFVLKRSHDLATFRRLVDPASRAYRRLRAWQAARNAVRRVIGQRGYEALRGLLVR
jgi:peptidoglycan/xylan/chitin deacetylase (PgdA/CDA1 family)